MPSSCLSTADYGLQELTTYVIRLTLFLKPQALRYGFVGSSPTRAFALEMENLVQRWYLIDSLK